MKSNKPFEKSIAPLGSIEPHAKLLNIPINEQMLYKVMRIEDFFNSISGNYLHFSKVDSYNDFQGADMNDGKQVPMDLQGNLNSKFSKDPTFSASDYYNKSRSRTYACCFSVENLEYIWTNYGNGSEKGKVCLIFNFGKLRFMLNDIIKNGNGILYNRIKCNQIFNINYGLIKYVNWDEYNANNSKLPNPIIYTYLKDRDKFKKESELRISLSAIGIGEFVLNNGEKISFPPYLQFSFNFREAIYSGAVKQILCSGDCNSNNLFSELQKFGINAIN